jgi:predicted dehydrogenase
MEEPAALRAAAPTPLARSHAPLRGAILGYGFIASQGHAPAYQELAPPPDEAQAASPQLRDTTTPSREQARFEIVAIGDVAAGSRERALRDFPEARVYDDFIELLRKETREHRLDFVDICAPPAFHYPYARAALEVGLHVLCEKPLTCTLAEADALIALARARGRILHPCHNYRYAPVVSRIDALLAAGAIGMPRFVSLQILRTGHARGTPDWRPDWRRDTRVAGGGIAFDHGSHAFYLLGRWLGLPALRARSVVLNSTNREKGDPENEDLVQAVVDFPNGVACLNLTWRAGLRKTVFSIHGPGGGIHVEDDRLELRSATGGNRTEFLASRWNDASHRSWYVPLLQDFYVRVARGAVESPELSEARESVAAIALLLAPQGDPGFLERPAIDAARPRGSAGLGETAPPPSLAADALPAGARIHLHGECV